MKSELKVDKSTRFFLLVVSLVLWAGIWLTGFAQVHWLLYIPAAFLLLAAITGLCPGMMFSRMLFGRKRPD